MHAVSKLHNQAFTDGSPQVVESVFGGQVTSLSKEEGGIGLYESHSLLVAVFKGYKLMPNELGLIVVGFITRLSILLEARLKSRT